MKRNSKTRFFRAKGLWQDDTFYYQSLIYGPIDLRFTAYYYGEMDDYEARWFKLKLMEHKIEYINKIL